MEEALLRIGDLEELLLDIAVSLTLLSLTTPPQQVITQQMRGSLNETVTKIGQMLRQGRG